MGGCVWGEISGVCRAGRVSVLLPGRIMVIVAVVWAIPAASESFPAGTTRHPHFPQPRWSSEEEAEEEKLN